MKFAFETQYGILHSLQMLIKCDNLQFESIAQNRTWSWKYPHILDLVSLITFIAIYIYIFVELILIMTLRTLPIQPWPHHDTHIYHLYLCVLTTWGGSQDQYGVGIGVFEHNPPLILGRPYKMVFMFHMMSAMRFLHWLVYVFKI